jgi:hypothetical protein
MSTTPQRFSLAILVWIFCAGIYSPLAQSGEADIKAAYIFNIVKYTTWPEASLPKDGHLLLCFVGDPSPLSEAMAGLHGKRFETFTIQVRMTTRISNLGACQMVILGQDVTFDSIKKSVPPNSLTVGEGENFANEGGGIGLFLLDNRIRFDVNLDSTSAHGIKLSSNLLRLARNVKGKQ